MLPSGLNATAHHKGKGKDKSKDKTKDKTGKKDAGKKHKGDKNANSTDAAALPPCVNNDTSVDISNSSAPEGNATPALTKKKQKTTAPGKDEAADAVKIGDIARSLFNIPRASRSPKRRLTPIPLWEADEE
jgi:hypothetical protein